MKRIACKERPAWRQRAEEFGFHFHTLYGEPYWDESAYYAFSLQQIEQDLEDPTAELQQMCLAAVDKVVRDEYWLLRFQIPEEHWDFIGRSWAAREPSLYSRLDLAYTGQGSAKLLENNADTPTSLYETGFWQWLWLEDKLRSGELPQTTDQFNSLQDQLVDWFQHYARTFSIQNMHFACCKDTDEDRGTVQYLQDCAVAAGINSTFIYMEDIGHSEGDFFTDLSDQVIDRMFKLYPWEFMLREEFGAYLDKARVTWLEPPWKAVLSNKALLPLLWQMFPEHPNLLPAYFEGDKSNQLTKYVKKPIFAREGANITIVDSGKIVADTVGPYGEEGYIYQAYTPLPQFDNRFALIGSWLVGDRPAGISVREDTQMVTQDLSRYLPHIITA